MKARKHGCARNGKKTPGYDAWRSMKQRCLVSTHKSFHNYGGRGVTVCKRWLNSFESFLKDMVVRPSKSHSLDRINNNGNYTPKNCRWATIKEQNANKRNVIVFNGENASDASLRIGGCITLVHKRIENGWSIKEAFTIPKGGKRG